MQVALGGQAPADIAEKRAQFHRKVSSVRTAVLCSLLLVLLGRSCLYHWGFQSDIGNHGRALLDDNESPERQVHCAKVSTRSFSEKCDFVTKHCDTEALVNYMKVYYCHVAPAGWLPVLGFQVACTFAMLLLFRVLSTTAEDYFSPILTQMSKDFYLPPRLAGVTLMAWGNGAPDIFSSMAAVKSGEYELALGGQLGAGMFIGTVVVGCVLGAGDGAAMRGALIRDVSSYALAIAAVGFLVASGEVTMWKAGLLLVGYFVFVAIVCAADVVHRLRSSAGFTDSGLTSGDDKALEEGLLTPLSSLPNSPRQSDESFLAPLPSGDPHDLQSQVSAIELQNSRQSSRSGSADVSNMMDVDENLREFDTFRDPIAPAFSAHLPPARRAASMGGDALDLQLDIAQQHRHGSGDSLQQRRYHHHRHSHHGASRAHPTYKEMVHMPGSKYRELYWADMDGDGDPRTQRLRRLGITGAGPARGDHYLPPVSSRASVDNCYLNTEEVRTAVAAHKHTRPGSASCVAQDAQPDSAAEAAPPAGGSSSDGDVCSSCDDAAEGEMGRTRRRWLQAAHYANLRGFVQNVLLQRLLLAVEVVEWPLTIARRATIPLLEQECYSRPWLLTSMFFAPIAVAAYFHDSWWAVVAAVVVGFAALVAALYTTQGPEFEDCPPDWAFGLTFPVGAVVAALFGFVVACMWISTVANELVGLLQFFGVLAHVSGLVLGLTLLAWGNSLPDMITDVAMARSGYGNMAMTACFAGPLCNILLGLGLGFLLLVADSPQHMTHVVLSLPVATDVIIIVINCIIVIALGLLNKGHLPARAAVVLYALYGGYLVINLIVHYL